MSEETTLSARIKILMKHFGINPEDKKSEERFAEKWGINVRTLYNYLKDAQSPDFKVLKKFSTSFKDINLNWFITGQGNMIMDSNKGLSLSNEPLEKYGNGSQEDPLFRQLVQISNEMVSSYDNFLLQKEKFTELIKTQHIG